MSSNNVIKKIKRRITSKYFITLNNDYKSTILIAGTGRSGTTWIPDIINYKNEYRIIFEPFHSYYVEECHGFYHRQYIKPTNKDSKFLKPAENILSGKVRNAWVDTFNKKMISNKRIVKDIRANLLLKWIHVNFPDIPIILLLRHPCAVAASKLKLKWSNHLNDYLCQNELVEDYLSSFKSEINSAKSDFDKFIFQWCIENYVPLKQFSPGQIHLAFYEEFCIRPEVEIKRMFDFLSKKYDESAYLIIKKPSAAAFNGAAVRSGANLINSWRNSISIEQTRRALEILNIFRLNTIYSEEAMPNMDNANAFLLK